MTAVQVRMCESLDSADKLAFQEALLSWFARARRDFPWRQKCDPYGLLLAEKLLQQSVARPSLTRAYGQLLAAYPSPADLAQASVADLDRVIAPLGLRYRAAELRAMACELVERHNGTVPDDRGKLLALTGVGEYCAAAVLSFAYRQDVPVVDTNVARFLYRLCRIPGKLPANPARSRRLAQMAAALLPGGRSMDFNFAVLDLCAAICRPSHPKCPECPVKEHCAQWSGHPSLLQGRDWCLSHP
jgi:A/G-specific adenine glycosylase